MAQTEGQRLVRAALQDLGRQPAQNGLGVLGAVGVADLGQVPEDAPEGLVSVVEKPFGHDPLL